MDEVQKIQVLVNKNSGAKAYRETVAQIERDNWGFDVEICRTSTLAEVDAVLFNTTAKTHRALVVVGGDGTLNHILKHVVEKQIPLGIIPAGTANDLANQLGVIASWRQLQELIIKNEPHAVDLVSVNDKYFATVGGIGLGAQLTLSVNKLRQKSAVFSSLWKTLGTKAYSFMAAQIALTSKRYLNSVRIKSKDIDVSLATSIVLICNQGFLGKDLLVVPHARNDDNLFEVVVLGKMNRFHLLHSIANTKRGKDYFKDLRFRTDFCEIESLKGEAMNVFGDGEFLVSAAKLSFRILPNVLKVYSTRTQGLKV